MTAATPGSESHGVISNNPCTGSPPVVATAAAATHDLLDEDSARSGAATGLAITMALPASVLGLCAIFQATRGLQPSDIWMAIVIGHVTRCTLSWIRFRQQK